MNARTPLPPPPCFDPANAERWEHTPAAERVLVEATWWRDAHAIAPAARDQRTVHLLVIDAQKDFCLPRGSLFVGGRSGRGALDDSRRLAEFIYHNLAVITAITTTMDTHFAYQIFFSSFWIDANGRPPAPLREITVSDLDRGELRPRPGLAAWLCGGDEGWLRDQVRFYCAELERAGRYRLFLWPPHCILGSDGHALAGVVHEARLFHAFARGAEARVEQKGGHPLTENYSVFRPEVLLRHDGAPLAQPNTELLRTLLRADALVIAGQAASHCVKSSVDDLLDAIRTQDARMATKVYLLGDCMSAVAIPDGRGGVAVDFTAQAEQALARYADAGMHVVRSTDPIASWPGFRV
jgi:nicotinamidase-related amidase